MIYSMYWNSVNSIQTKDYMRRLGYTVPQGLGIEAIGDYEKYTARLTADAIKESENDSFVFMVTKTQVPEVKAWVEAQGLEEYISFQLKECIMNRNYVDHGRKIMIIIFQSKNHFARIKQ